MLLEFLSLYNSFDEFKYTSSKLKTLNKQQLIPIILNYQDVYHGTLMMKKRKNYFNSFFLFFQELSVEFFQIYFVLLHIVFIKPIKLIQIIINFKIIFRKFVLKSKICIKTIKFYINC